MLFSGAEKQLSLLGGKIYGYTIFFSWLPSFLVITYKVVKNIPSWGGLNLMNIGIIKLVLLMYVLPINL